MKCLKTVYKTEQLWLSSQILNLVLHKNKYVDHKNKFKLDLF